MGKNGDPQTGWMKEGVLEQTGCSFPVDKFQQLSTIQGYICIVSDVGVPKLVSAVRIIRVRISGVRASAFPIGGIQGEWPVKLHAHTRPRCQSN